LKRRVKRRKNMVPSLALSSKLNYVERLIQRSNIRVFLPYSVGGHLFICLLFFLLGFLSISHYMNIIVAIIFGIGLSILPFLILRIITDVISYRIKRMAVDFLIIFKNFLIAGKVTDIFEAFKKLPDMCQNL